ncbi:MAG: GNAT family protein [Bacteroidales bacterium]|jgi:RimJ/RimL family protein N-acetyltransferase|nr:GNAT family protein [Bacteroidales bacterium]MDX9889813.1 GNAT family protein [Bacteroidales bacterium]NLO41661.1 GNAT family N-acetyltransferase [Bacteroidales bacterium]
MHTSLQFGLREWKINDLDSLVLHGINPNISKFMSDAFPDTKEKWERFLRNVITDKSLLYRAIDIDGKAVGGIGISPHRGEKRCNAELGYWLSETYWNRGIITTAVKQILSLAFETYPDLKRIYATPYGNNTTSHKVLIKAGFTLEARFEKIILKNNEFLDEYVFAYRKVEI